MKADAGPDVTLWAIALLIVAIATVAYGILGGHL
jgi:hypothetical protein